MPQGQPATNTPEKKFGPFAGGVSVCVWRNEIDTDGGKRLVRSITISPRRYRDKDGEWQDSSSFRCIDLAALILALDKAQEYITTTPLPEQAGAAEDFGDVPY